MNLGDMLTSRNDNPVRAPFELIRKRLHHDTFAILALLDKRDAEYRKHKNMVDYLDRQIADAMQGGSTQKRKKVSNKDYTPKKKPTLQSTPDSKPKNTKSKLPSERQRRYTLAQTGRDVYSV